MEAREGFWAPCPLEIDWLFVPLDKALQTDLEAQAAHLFLMAPVGGCPRINKLVNSSVTREGSVVADYYVWHPRRPYDTLDHMMMTHFPGDRMYVEIGTTWRSEGNSQQEMNYHLSLDTRQLVFGVSDQV